MIYIIDEQQDEYATNDAELILLVRSYWWETFGEGIQDVKVDHEINRVTFNVRVHTGTLEPCRIGFKSIAKVDSSIRTTGSWEVGTGKKHANG